VTATVAGPAEVVRPPVPRSELAKRWVRDRGVYVALGLLVLYNLATSEGFASRANINLNLIQAAVTIIVSLGMAVVIGTEGIDLSVGAVMAIAAVLMPDYMGYGLPVAILVAVLAGAAVGLVNGLLVAVVGVQPIVATLGTLVTGRALAQVYSNGRLTEIFDPGLRTLGTGSTLGVPNTALIALVLAVLVGILVRRTTFGRRVVAIGGNTEASVLAGLPVKRTLITVYLMSGVLAAIAGVLYTARSGAANPGRIGELIELSAITAVVVGGTALTGGRVRILATVAGALLLQILFATLTRNNLGDADARMIQAAIVIGAVYIQRDRSGA
jgi:ribose transport system permease protein